MAVWLRESGALRDPRPGEYWVVDLDERLAVVHRQPQHDGYAQVVKVPRGGAIEPQALALAALALSELMAAVG